MRLRIVATILVILGALIVIGVMRFSFTALPQPGVLETRVANLAKSSFIQRASGHGIPLRPRDKETSIEIGSAEYGSNCSVCHASNGRSQGTPGQWMYPRASDLTSKRVQSYSDQELYWIIQNGIRYTGMPAFGRIETPEHIWGLVSYVRTLANDSGKDNSTK